MSKITITTPIDKLRLHAPANVIEMLKATHYYVSSSDAIVIRSDEHREQGQNRNGCFKKLCDVYLKAGEDAVKGERSNGPPKALSVMISTLLDALYSSFPSQCKESSQQIEPPQSSTTILGEEEHSTKGEVCGACRVQNGSKGLSKREE